MHSSTVSAYCTILRTPHSSRISLLKRGMTALKSWIIIVALM
jgi:hypothetical protein